MTKPSFRVLLLSGLVSSFALVGALEATAQTPPSNVAAVPQKPWMDQGKTSEARVKLLLGEMTLEEKLLLVFGYASGDQLMQIDPAVIPGVNTKEVLSQVIKGSAGYIPGVPRLGIPAQFQSDASMGVCAIRFCSVPPCHHLWRPPQAGTRR